MQLDPKPLQSKTRSAQAPETPHRDPTSRGGKVWEFPKIRGTFKGIYKGSFKGSYQGSVGFRV